MERKIPLIKREDLYGNKLEVYLTGEQLTAVYKLFNGEIAEKTFAPEDLREGLYRVAKICTWMAALAYTNTQRIIFLDEGVMK